MVSNSSVLSRRNFLLSMLALPPAAIAKPAKSLSPLPGIAEPEFWFGQQVKFWWTDENSGQAHSESGQVIGVVWNFPEARWEYAVMWLSSTAYPTDDYPKSDGSLWAADVLWRSNNG